jgi:DNA-binding Lrp family transcriptional regulator
MANIAKTRGPLVRAGYYLKMMDPDDGLSALDRNLITQLQVDGRASFAQLARECRTTEKTARRRVGELREKGIIEISTVTDPTLLGYSRGALVGLRIDGGRSASTTGEKLFRISSVDYAVSTSGRYDFLVELLCKDQNDLHRVIETQIRKDPAIRHVEIYPYLKLHYQQPIWTAAQGKDQPKTVTALTELDTLDREILRELSNDGRVVFATVAQRLKVSETQIRNRYARMTSSGAIRVMALTNPRSLGFGTIAWLAIAAAPSAKIEMLADKLSALPSITYLVVCVGRFDIFAEVVCRDPIDLMRLLDSQVRTMPEIARVETSLCFDLFYRRVIPSPAP